jgi:hypothetical protein
VSTAGDRVAVPTNGHHPALTDDPADLPPGAGPDTRSQEPAPAVPTVSPGQVIAGFGIMAALILLILGRRRGRGG